STPAYRSLSEGMSGQDARQLNADLVALGYATSADLDPTSDEFSSSTRRALKRLQADLSVAETGTLTLGQAVFLPGPVRIKTVSATIGSPAGQGSPILQATSNSRIVTIALAAGLQMTMKVDDRLTVTRPPKLTP